MKHERNLLQDLQHLKEQHGVTCVLCLLNTAELRSFGLRDYEAGIQKAGLRLLTFPIIEMAAPVCINATHTIIKQTTELVAQGHHVAVHCRGGVGRAGMVAACLLLFTNQAGSAKVRRPLPRLSPPPARRQNPWLRPYSLSDNGDASRP